MSLSDRLLQHLSALLDLVAPFACLACGDRCETRDPLCARCVLAADPSFEAPAWVSVAHAFSGPVALAVHRAKYGGDPSAAARLGELLAPFAASHRGESDLVAPVPLSRWRLCVRGYNQSVELSRAVARHSGARLTYDLLTRVRETPSQTRFGREARRENVHGAFAARGVSGARVLLIDDVVTTGATLFEARNALLAAGARSVACAAVAHATLLQALPNEH